MEILYMEIHPTEELHEGIKRRKVIRSKWGGGGNLANWHKDSAKRIILIDIFL
jgi:hypothetical protein